MTTSGDGLMAREPLELYLLAHATGKPEYIFQAFTPEARILFVRDGQLCCWTLQDFAARFPGKPADDEAGRVRRIEQVDVTGISASAKVVLDYPGVTLTDYMSLLFVENTWKIVSKIFNSEQKQ